MKKITHLYFDLDHTLWDTDKNSEESLNQLFKDFSLQDLGIPSFDDFMSKYKSHNERLWGLYAENKIGKDAVRVHRFMHTFQDFGIHDLDKAHQMAEVFVSITPRKKNLISGALELLEELNGKYKLAIITNGFKESQHIKMDSSGLSKYFEDVFISEEIGINKPDPGIFHYVMEKTGATSPTQCVMIGDTYQTDIVGAMSAGMHAIHLNPFPTLDNHQSDHITSVKHLNEINGKLMELEMRLAKI